VFVQKKHNRGHTVRLERSGGAISKNLRLVQAMTHAYDAIARNEDNMNHKKVTWNVTYEKNKDIYSCECGYELPIDNSIEDKTENTFYNQLA